MKVGLVTDAGRSDKQGAANSVKLNRDTDKGGRGPDGGQAVTPYQVYRCYFRHSLLQQFIGKVSVQHNPR